jgi:hypothetical protein
MAENVQQLQDRTDELELVGLVERGVSFLRKFGTWIIIFSVIGLALGILLYTLSPKLYPSTLLLHSVILTNEEEIAIIGTWKDLMRRGERAAVADALNIDSATMSKVGKIDAEQIQKLYTQNNPNGFIVRVLVKDTAILDELEKGIVHGLESSSYVQERVMSRRANLDAMIQEVKKELSKLDSMKTSIQHIITGRNSRGSSFMLDVTGINSQWIGLNEKLLSLQEELRFVNAVQVLQSFSKIRKPESPKLLKTLFFGVLAGGFIGYIIALFRYLFAKLRERSATKNPRSPSLV